MPKGFSSFLSLVRLLPRAIFFLVALSGLYLVATILAAGGSRSLLDDMSSTFRRWYLFPPKTEEEKAQRIVAQINLRMTLLGFGPLGFLRHMMWRALVRPVMGSFLDAKLKDIQKANMGLYAPLNDTEMVIGATTLLDKFLAMALIIKFSGTLSRTQYEDLFEGYGPLSAFSDKISAGSALGVIIGDMQHDFTILRKLRNDFAHSLSPIKLADAGFSNRCRALKMTYELNADVMAACGSVERQKFLQSAAAILLHLAVLIQRGMIERQLIQKNFKEINRLTQEEMEKIRANAATAAKPAT